VSGRFIAPGAPAPGSPAPAPGAAPDAPVEEDPAEPFSRRARLIIIGVTAVSIVAAVFFAVFGADFAVVPSASADGYSRSALGHHAFVSLLRELGAPVVMSRHDSAGRAGERGLLVLAEPSAADDEALQDIGRMVGEASRVLVILPKRRGDEDPEKRAWLRDAWLRDTWPAERVLAAAGVSGSVSRFDRPTLPENTLGIAPTLTTPVQLITSSTDLEPVIAGPEGILLGRVAYGADEVWVLADPDLIANHGLGDGDNARLAVAMIDEAHGGDDGPIVFDETLHGHVAAPSLWRELATFPLSLATTTALLVLAALLWSASGRFGKVQPPPPPIEPGKRFLIENTAELLRQGGHSAHAVERYFAATLQDVARRVHAPAHLSAAELRGHLARLARQRGVGTDLAALEHEVADVAREPSPARALAAAVRIHRFRQEMIDGPGKRPRGR
jgi:hypothetical protein